MSSEIKFYFDENIAKSIAEGLRRREVDVITVVEAGTQGADDTEHFSFVNENNNRSISLTACLRIYFH